MSKLPHILRLPCEVILLVIQAKKSYTFTLGRKTLSPQRPGRGRRIKGGLDYRVGAKMPLPGLSGAAAERYGATPSSAGCPMPYRFNEPRRHKIPRARYRVQNWPEYDRALQRRGDLTVWVTPEAIAVWCPPRTGRRGRPRDYSDVAIETGHLLRLAFGRPWRQTEGLLRSLATLLGLDIGVPDHTTFSRRSPGLTLASSLAQAQRTGSVH